MCRMRSRLGVAVAILAASQLHRFLFGAVENSVSGMLYYHGAAALFDFGTIVLASHALQGQLSIDMQRLCLASMIVNFMGWLAYLAYLPPTFYDAAIVALGYAQLVRLLWVDGNVDYPVRMLLFRGGHSRGPQFHPETGKR